MIWVRADLTWVAASAQRPLRVTFLRIVTLAVTGTRKLFWLGSARREDGDLEFFETAPRPFWLAAVFRTPQFYDKWCKVDAKPDCWTELLRHLDGTTSKKRLR